MKIIDPRQKIIVNEIEIDNPNYQKIINFKGIDLTRNVVQLEIQDSRYNNPIEQIQICNLSDTAIGLIDVIIRDCELEQYEGYIKLEEFNDWVFPEKSKRIFVSESDVAYFAANHIEFVNMIYSEPKNPYIKIDGGYEVYLNSIVDEALPLLELRGIIVQNKPE